METVINFIVGDYCGDGHNKYETIQMLIKCPDNINIEETLNIAEEEIKNQFAIDLASWFADYEDNIINSEDIHKLKSLGINLGENTVLNENESLVCYTAEDYFHIWKQLIEKVNPTIKIEQLNLPTFFSKCSGYGLYE